MLHNCDRCTNPSNDSLSSTEKTDENWKSSAIKGLESIYFTDQKKLNPEIMTLLNYGTGKGGKQYMHNAYEKMKKEIEESDYIKEEKCTNLKGEEGVIRGYETNDNRSGERCSYLFYYDQEGNCHGFVKYFTSYHLKDEYLALMSKTESYKEINANNFGYVELLAVEKSARDKGTGKILMSQCEKNLKRGGKNFCVLYTFDEKQVGPYKTAHIFYEKLGYENGTAGGDIKGKKTTYMVKRLQ